MDPHIDILDECRKLAGILLRLALVVLVVYLCLVAAGAFR